MCRIQNSKSEIVQTKTKALKYETIAGIKRNGFATIRMVNT